MTQATIELNLLHGKRALIDETDIDILKYKWYADKLGKGPNSVWYAARHIRLDNRESVQYMHRAILTRVFDRPLQKHEQVDHINHDGLDNRRSNLRLVTNQENHYNMRMKQINKTSRFKGVWWCKERNRWAAMIRINGKGEHLGRFEKEDDAARAYDKAAKNIFATFCCLNFPDECGKELEAMQRFAPPPGFVAKKYGGGVE